MRLSLSYLAPDIISPPLGSGGNVGFIGIPVSPSRREGRLADGWVRRRI
jgi:hypothetical protein